MWKDVEKIIEKYVIMFRCKRDLAMADDKQIKEILTNEEYPNFLKSINDFLISKLNSSEIPITEIEYYIEANKAINRFWELLIEKELNIDFKPNRIFNNAF